ncbi:hypothetical protein FOA52_004014 [Chlamydomonas sp. UWO 241]|nr:hypothetical protein FOA52_004014 [Chlamydomonas sp. UWO 241]
MSSDPLLNGAPAAERDATSSRTFRRWFYDQVEGPFDSPVEYFILYLIFAQTLALLVSTLVCDPDPDCFGSECERLGDRYVNWFEGFEAASVAIFTIEYVARLYSAVEHPPFAGYTATRARVAYATQIFSIIDLASILPYWISMLPFVDESPDFVTAIRVFRLVRLFKADKYINAFAILGRVLADNSTLLVATSFYSCLAWFISAALLFFTEQNNAALGFHFQSIPSAMFPTLLMLTGEFPLSDFTVAGSS